MKIVFIQGGLGNQIFQYAFFRYLIKKGYRRVYLDGAAGFISKHGGFELKRLFPSIAADQRVLPYWKARPPYLLGELLRLIFRLDLRTDEEQPKGRKLWWKAHWQEYRYPEYVREEIVKSLEFIPIEDEKNVKILQLITSTNAVSIHVRRGDYLQPHMRPMFGDICSTDYYHKAIGYIRGKVENPQFFVFSDDPDWVKKNLSPECAVYVDWNRGKDSFRDMQLMSCCKHHIIANSSFSWWGAWLSPYPEKLVVCPAKWFHNFPVEKVDRLLPPDWHRIGQRNPNVSLLVDDDISEDELRPVMQQKYADFEIIRTTRQPKGNHVFRLLKSELPAYKNKKYLIKKMVRYFQMTNSNLPPD